MAQFYSVCAYWATSLLFPGLEVYLNRNDSIKLYVLDLSQPDSVTATKELAEAGATFIVLNQPRVPSSFDEMYREDTKLVAAYPKPGGESEIEVWQFRRNSVQD